MPFRKMDLDFVVFFPPLLLCEVSYGSPSEVLVTHLTSSVTKTYVLWQADVDSSFPKDEKHVTESISQTQGKAL